MNISIQRTTGFLITFLILVTAVSCDMLGTSGSPDRIDWEDGEQIIPADDQHLDEETRALYQKDAEKLAVRYINETEPERTNIPGALVDLLYNGLIHIVNEEGAKATEVTETYNVHARTPVEPREIIVSVDTTAPWIEAWRNETTETDDEEVDALLEEFSFILTEYNELESTLPTAMATLRSDSAINGYAVGAHFEELNYIESAGPDGVTDGSDIGVLFFDDHLLFTFDYGFGDCPSGCINRHIWYFRVFMDGSVEFVEEEGDPLPTG